MKKVVASGPENARVLVVGECADQRDVETGTPFSGPQGNVLKQSMLAQGISPRDVRYTYILPFRPPGGAESHFARTGKVVTPVTHEAVDGLMALKHEIDRCNPNVILGLGNYSLWALTRLNRVSAGRPSGITDWRGSVVSGSPFTGERKVLLAQNPEYINRVYKELPLFENDIWKLKQEMEYPDIRRKPREIILDPRGHARELIIQQLLDSGKPIGFDIEYIPASDRWICISFSIDPSWGVSWAIRGAGDIEDARRILESGRPLVAQNGMFDCSMLEHWFKIDCMRHLWFDTMLASHAAYIELPKDLGTMCSLYTDQPCYWTELEPGHWKQPVSDSWLLKTMKYNTIDSYVTIEIKDRFIAEELQDEKIRRTFEFEMRLLNPLWKMARRGVRVDTTSLVAFKHELDQKELVGVEELRQLTNKAINVKSGVQIAKLLFGPTGEFHLPVQGTTPKGAPATDDRALVSAAQYATPEGRRVIDVIRTIRECKDLKSKFLNIRLDSDQRIRCHYNPGGTVTGRLSSKKYYPTGSGGNLQNIPQDKRIRRLFIPDDGYTFFYNDLKSAESHVVAHLTGDPLMLELHKPGMKPHEVTASLLFDKPVESIGKDSVERFLGKMTRHACNYMMGWMRFMDNINAREMETGVRIDAKTAKMLIAKYRQIHPFLETWWRSVEWQLSTTRTLYNLLGRPRRFFDRISACLPTAIAYVPQGTVGDVVNEALILIDSDEELRDYDLQMLLQVHDAIGGQVKTEYTIPAMRRFQQLIAIPLTTPQGETFTIPLDVSVGPSWGDVKELAI